MLFGFLKSRELSWKLGPILVFSLAIWIDKGVKTVGFTTHKVVISQDAFLMTLYYKRKSTCGVLEAELTFVHKFRM